MVFRSLPIGHAPLIMSAVAFNRRTALFTGLVGASLLPLSQLFGRGKTSGEAGPPGPRVLTRDPTGTLDVPPDFQVRVLERAGSIMSDGLVVPALPDGMGLFREGPNLVLMRNHELHRARNGSPFRDGRSPKQAFEAGAFGGVTRLVVSPELERVSSNLVLTGTLRNCAGGVSPWGWLSCEESVEPGHGYVFLCDPKAQSVAAPRPITAYGRFNHEAACIDPKTNAAYLTEDQHDGCLYRFLPSDPQRPFEGKLQALGIVGEPQRDLGLGVSSQQVLRARWLDLENTNPKIDDLRATAKARGAAIIRRGEGIDFHDGQVFIVSTSGGPLQRGQIFILKDGIEPRISLLAQAEKPTDFDMPDNVCISPWGDAIIAEDGRGDQFLRGITQEGRVYDIARNAVSSSEFAGVCFSPDGKTLFFNLQGDGLTLALTGPFERLGKS